MSVTHKPNADEEEFPMLEEEAELGEHVLSGENPFVGPFVTKEDVKNHLIEWSIRINKSFRVFKSSLRRYEVICGERETGAKKKCQFKVSLYFSMRRGSWSAKHYIPHSCGPLNIFKKAPISWLISKFKAFPGAKNPENLPLDFQNAIKLHLGIDIPYSSAWKCTSLLNKEAMGPSRTCLSGRRPGRPPKKSLVLADVFGFETPSVPSEALSPSLENQVFLQIPPPRRPSGRPRKPTESIQT